MRYFTSDIHFGHVDIIEYVPRPFKDVDHMNEELIRRWNETVSANDEVWIVGDFAMGKIDTTLHLALRLNGYKILIPGNHDRCWAGASGTAEKNKKWRDRYSMYFEIMDGPVDTTLGDHEVIVNHFPYIELARHGDRYSAWRSNYEGKWLVHGHTHLQEPINVGNSELHVGTDAWDYRPVAESKLIELLDQYA